ncbi:TPA: hypothetical protein ACF96D_001094 [Salmonella enterica subsp. enterica serovar Newport]
MSFIGCLIGLRHRKSKHFSLYGSTGLRYGVAFFISGENMKLSPEAKQAIKTAIEQLRLLLVDDAMDTVREEVSRQWMNDGDVESLERLKKTFIHLAKVVIDDEMARRLVEKRPGVEALDGINLKRIKETFLQISSEVIAREKT